MSEDSAIAIDDDGVDAPPAAPETLAPIAHVALPPGVSQVDFDAALAVGREKGQLTQDELIEALHTVELTPEVLTTLLTRVNAEGVVLVEEDEEELPSSKSSPAQVRPGREQVERQRQDGDAPRDERQAGGLGRVGRQRRGPRPHLSQGDRPGPAAQRRARGGDRPDH